MNSPVTSTAVQTPRKSVRAAQPRCQCMGETMPRMICPVCGSDMRSRSLLSHYSLKPYRVCPDCNAKYRADPKTRKRQIPIALLALTALVLTLAVGLEGMAWLLPAIASHIILWVYIGYAISKTVYVRYPD